ncbi:protein timeless-like [Lepeophtheirus salmonis]|uniref:protein timeless-like n=1 Tax=Lepeophtheirus salmonis TaxID=72036 RepID=UPI001AE6A5A5|nr:protein timeless-like [Lepeophtheirus salmonis]
MYNDTMVKTQGRRLHLVVSAIKQILITINWMENNARNSEDRSKIHNIILLLMEMSNLRQFHLLLIRKFSSSNQTRCFINDVIMSNYQLLEMFEKVKSSDKFMNKHLEQFATVDVMRQYGYCLQKFESNTVSLNKAVCTMMHHISGELNTHEALFIPQILKTFSDIWENELFDKDQWLGLIEYSPDSEYNNSEDPFRSIIDMYKEEDCETMTGHSILQALWSYGIITHAQYIEIARVNPTLATNYTSIEATRSFISELASQRGESESGTDNSPITNEILEFSAPSPSEKAYVDEIEGLKDLLVSQGKEYLIDWLQEEIFNVILVKTHAKSKSSVEWKEGVLESIPYYSVFWNEGTLLVPWNIKEESGLKTNNFIMLLKKIGIHLPAKRHTHFPRIPFDWSIDHLLNIHRKLASSQHNEADWDMGQNSFLSGANSHDDVTSMWKISRANKLIGNLAKPNLQNTQISNEDQL